MRGTLISELVRGVGVVKAYAFEERWGARVHTARVHELRALATVKYINAFVMLICNLLSQT